MAQSVNKRVLTDIERKQFIDFAKLLYDNVDDTRLNDILNLDNPVKVLSDTIKTSNSKIKNIIVDPVFDKYLKPEAPEEKKFLLNNQYGKYVVVLAREVNEKSESPYFDDLNRSLSNLQEAPGILVESVKLVPGVRYELRELVVDTFFESTQNWVRDFKVKLGELFTKAGISEKLFDRMVIPKYMKVWLQAFTHETYSNTNYEELEFMGDAILKPLFSKLLLVKYPHLKKSDLTNLNSRYMSTEINYQATLARRLGLSQFIESRILGRISFKINTDIFESFFGAILNIGDDIELGIGYRVAYDVLKISLDNDEFTDTSANAKTQVGQIFTRFNGMNVDIDPHEEQVLEEVNGMIRFIIRIPMNTANFFRAVTGGYRQGDKVVGGRIDIKDLELANVTATGKDAAGSLAYSKALEKLESYGLTTDIAKALKEKLEFMVDPVILQDYQKIKNKMRGLGYDKYYFISSSKSGTNGRATMQLIGVDKTGKSHILQSDEAANGKTEARRNLVRKFLSS
ncbi:MAG: RNAse III [Solumvirus sp.]|uniref:RNAse III n=1 Tax=Solumvirus sp. TaxID=2487773 RepID=A0A3G5AI77_9VIRU|nr:MAG: RNAse III [Solumvirus sp.]